MLVASQKHKIVEEIKLEGELLSEKNKLKEANIQNLKDESYLTETRSRFVTGGAQIGWVCFTCNFEVVRAVDHSRLRILQNVWKRVFF